jgi:hypothetical protein
MLLRKLESQLSGHRLRSGDRAASKEAVPPRHSPWSKQLTGTLSVHIDSNPVITLETGDCVYFDSSYGHAYLTAGQTEAIVPGVCWQPETSNEHLPRPSDDFFLIDSFPVAPCGLTVLFLKLLQPPDLRRQQAVIPASS